MSLRPAVNARPMTSVRLELLLILSALLSAVTGAFTGVREPGQRLHHAAAALESTAAEAPRTAAAILPAAIADSVAAFAAPVSHGEGAAFALALAAPLDTIRLLE
jgi:hypothetical protein